MIGELAYLGGKDVLDTAFHVAPGDERPLPFSKGQRVCVAKGPVSGGALARCCVGEGAPGGPTGTAFAPWSAAWADAPGAGCGCGASGERSPEYVEAFRRLDALSALAEACGPEAARIAADTKARLARVFNAGVFRLPDGSYDCDPDEAAELRPTVGQVRAALLAFAQEVGKNCADERDRQLLTIGAQAPLSERAQLARSIAVPLMLGALGVAYLAWRFLARST